MDSDDIHVCFWSGPIELFTTVQAPFKWLTLIPDKAINEVSEDHKAGMVSLRMQIKPYIRDEISPDLNRSQYWQHVSPRRLNAWKIRCFIFQCADLPSSDEDGTSDPFIEIWTPGEKITT